MSSCQVGVGVRRQRRGVHARGGEGVLVVTPGDLAHGGWWLVPQNALAGVANGVVGGANACRSNLDDLQRCQLSDGVIGQVEVPAAIQLAQTSPRRHRLTAVPPAG